MKYPRSIPMPRDVQDWLEGELEARGIDAVVYTRYILSLMLQDFDSLYEPDPDLHPKGVGSQADYWPSWDQHALKRFAVVQCLMSVTPQKCGIESLVDELSVKLQESSSAAKGPAIIQPSEFAPYSDYNNSFPPLRKNSEFEWNAERGKPTAAWTRGILCASLKGFDSGNPYDDMSFSDYFPLTHKTIQGDTLDIYGPRLYERSANRSLEQVMAGLDATFHQFWAPDDVILQQTDANQPNYTYFQDQFPSALLWNEAKWSLGMDNTVADLKDDVVEVAAAEPIPVPPKPEEPEEDLLTSARTHFRPIRSDDSGQTRVYEDGTTFAISNDMDQLEFQRSESGILFLDTGKYMEYKNEDADGECNIEEFVPKFRVQQSNEKFCQTDDLDLLAVETDEPDTITSLPEIEEDEFFFPGDDELALDLSSDEHNEGEVAEIVSGRLNVRWKGPNVKPPSPATEISEPDWDAEDAAMVDDLVDSPSWNQCSDTDDNMESSQACWPLTDNIWNTDTSSCENCRRGKPESPDALLNKQGWSDIWKQPVCDACTDSALNLNTDDSEKTADDWPKLGATLSAYLRRSRANAVDLLSVWGPGFSSSHESLSDTDGLRDIWSSAASDEGVASLEIWSPVSEEKREAAPVSRSLLRDELCRDGDKLLSDLSCLHLQQIDDSAKTDASDTLDDEDADEFPTSPPSPIIDGKGPSIVSLWAAWDVISIGDDITILDERRESVQNERKRRHSSSLRMCELYLDGECRRAHCRFRHESSPVAETVCVTAHPIRYGRELNRAFTF